MVALPASVFDLRCANSAKPDLTAICLFLHGDRETTSEIRTWLSELFEPIRGSLFIGGRKIGRPNTNEQNAAQALIDKFLSNHLMAHEERVSIADLFDDNATSSCRVKYRSIKRGRGDTEILPHYTAVMAFYDEKDRLKKIGVKPVWDTAIEHICKWHGSSKTTLVGAIGAYQNALTEHARILNDEFSTPLKTASPKDGN